VNSIQEKTGMEMIDDEKREEIRRKRNWRDF
jgi:hypothetical protein